MSDEYDDEDVAAVDTIDDSSSEYSDDTSSYEYEESELDIPDEVPEDTYEDSMTDLEEEALDVPEEFEEDISYNSPEEITANVPEEFEEDIEEATVEDNQWSTDDSLVNIPEDTESEEIEVETENTSEQIEEDVVDGNTEVESTEEQNDEELDDVEETDDVDTTDEATEQAAEPIEETNEVDSTNEATEEEAEPVEESNDVDTTDDVADEESEPVEETDDVDTTDEATEQAAEPVEETNEVDSTDEATEQEAEPVEETNEADITEAESTGVKGNIEYKAKGMAEKELAQDDARDIGDLTQEEDSNRISEYYRKHEYSIEDYDTYSQDPEWRDLMRKAYPELELPELAISQEEASNRISEYYGKHEYSIEDYDTYSQDPEWRELMRIAHPEIALPSLGENNIVSDKTETPEIIENVFDDSTNNELANGRVPQDIFSKESTPDLGEKRLEDFTQKEYARMVKKDPERASQLLTDFNNRSIKADDVNKLNRGLYFTNGDRYQVVDKELSNCSARIKDSVTGIEYNVYPNPMKRMVHFDGDQGQNDIGMRQDCGIASTAKSINDLYEKRVTCENRLANYARKTNNCEMCGFKRSKWGGTVESNVANFYRANGIECDVYEGDKIPELSILGEALKNGGSSTVAVSSDLLWLYGDSQKFDASTVDTVRYERDSEYARRIDTLIDIKSNNKTFEADHFVNVSNAVYDDNNNLTHFIVSDTGNGTTKMISLEDFQRAYNGLGNFRVRNQGCVIAKGIIRR